jgi:predicted amidohydrolase YtcJ
MEPGKLGDIAVLSADYTDPAKVPDQEIRNLKSVLTIVGGKVVYDDLH